LENMFCSMEICHGKHKSVVSSTSTLDFSADAGAQ